MSYALGKCSGKAGILEYIDPEGQSIESLIGKDLGMGISLFHLIRRDFDKTLLTNCLSYINREGGIGIASERDWKALLSMLKKMHCTMTPANKRWVAETFGKMQNPEAVVWMFRSLITGDLWLGILDGCTRLSGIVASRMEKYHSNEELLSDLEQISTLGKWGRMQYSSKIFEMCYGTGMHSEVAYECYDSPCLCSQDGDVYWKAIHVLPQQIFPVLTDRGIVLLKNRSSCRAVVPVMNCTIHTLDRPQFQKRTFGLEVEIWDRMQAVYRQR